MVKQKVFEEVFKNMIRIQIDDILDRNVYNFSSTKDFHCIFTHDTSNDIESMFIDFEGVFCARPLGYLCEDQFRFVGFINMYTGAVTISCVRLIDSETLRLK